MEDNRDNLVVIFAGYTKEMQDFINSNSGIASRIGYTLNFKDYTEDELLEIFKGMVKKAGFKITNEALYKARNIIKEHLNDKNFGNARFVRNMYEKTVTEHATNTKDKRRKDVLITITDKDINIDNVL
jgi:Cdc6-like AAA superfamily ATPase